jgi:nucleolar complex protein 3
MIKERKFQVHPNVLSCLLHLRLLGELDSMRDGKNAKGKGKNPGGAVAEGEDLVGKGKKFKSETRKVWATKNQRKKEKELKEVRKEMAEAEAEVDKDERAQIVSLT